MEYPPNPQPKNEWYMMTLPSSAKTDDSFKYDSAWICFACVGHQGWHDYKCVKLSDPDFKRKWLALIAEAKERIDALNSQPGDVIVGQVCGQCDNDAAPGDYLCEDCRKNS